MPDTAMTDDTAKRRRLIAVRAYEDECAKKVCSIYYLPHKEGKKYDDPLRFRDQRHQSS